jgi:hypothetical protein
LVWQGPGGETESLKAAMAIDVWKNYFDVVILPSKDVANHAIDLSSQLQGYGAKFVLGKRRYIPHISLYHIPVSPENFSDFATALKSVAAKHSGGELKLQKLDLPVIQTDKPDWLKSFHRAVVDNSLEYFNWKHGAEETWNTDYLPAHLKDRARSNLKKYGSPLVGSVFRPHITLTSFEQKSVISEIPPLKVEPLSFPVNAITICELGPSHSCQRIVKTFQLGSEMTKL